MEFWLIVVGLVLVIAVAWVLNIALADKTAELLETATDIFSDQD